MTDIKNLLGEAPCSAIINDFVSELASLAQSSTSAEIKSYPDAVYFNYLPLGISLMFLPKNGYKHKTGLKRDQLQEQDLMLDSIDVYNVPKPKEPKSNASSSRTAELAFTSFPRSPFALLITEEVKDKDGKVVPRPPMFDVLPDTTGKDFVNTLGEPDRKGGGAGPSSGSIGIWCEWSKDGIMVEFGGDEARGPQAWERGKDAIWKVITVFRPQPKA